MGSGVEILKTRSTLTISINSHKRYLSEIMASSLNGLTVGDPLQENLMESPARSADTMFFAR
ncbi:protein TPRXL [Salix suchowensis]|nr:protein TPRXL [Salix suchowensis]